LTFTNLDNINYKLKGRILFWTATWDQKIQKHKRKVYKKIIYDDIPGSLSPNAPSTSELAKDGSSHVCGSNP
jgi:hypothetical protein